MADMDLAGLEAAFKKDVERIKREAKREIQKGAKRVKEDWKDNLHRRMSTPSRIAHIPRVTTYSSYELKYTYDAVIGYDKGAPGDAGKQAELGHIFEYGAPGANVPPHNDGGRALRAEAPRLFAAMAKIVEFDV